MNETEGLSPIILVQNERTAGGLYDHWQDVTGERYQYPNQYKNKVLPGRRFVYYRGSRRADGTRAIPEYFGHGRIASIGIDPETDTSARKANWKWICEIDDYWSFPLPVPFKIGEKTFEEIAQNQWSVAVREISEQVYQKILAKSGLPAGLPAATLIEGPSHVDPRESEESLLVRASVISKDSDMSTQMGAGVRRSARAVAIGRRGEQIALTYLKQTLTDVERETLRWVAQQGETPGWDIEYKSGDRLIAVEVKATVGPLFPSLEFTNNEWQAARRLRDSYKVLLVAGVLQDKPQLQLIIDPIAAVEHGALHAEASVWRIRAVDPAALRLQ